MAKKKASKKAPVKKPQQLQLGPPLRLPQGVSTDLQPQTLLLDPQNLRLLERVNADIRNVKAKLIGQPSIQNKIFKTMWEDPLFDVSSLETSIMHNGFLKHERLIVARYNAEKYLVLEGNRRLTSVKHIYQEYGSKLEGLPSNVRQSLQTLPCFVLEGEPIGNDDAILEEYRRAAEIYIGMRHLMGAKRWEPASRYEFQARLILEEHWSPADVAERFGRKKNEVIRDLKAQRLYHDFRDFEQKSKIEHSLTYNAFAEASRSPDVMNWLGWSNDRMVVVNKKREEIFFHYLISRLKLRARVGTDETDEEIAGTNAEEIVRQLRDMLKLRDTSIQESLEDRDFDSADLFFEEKREGDFAKKVVSYTRALRRVTTEDLSDKPNENKTKLNQLIEQAQKLVKVLDALR